MPDSKPKSKRGKKLLKILRQMPRKEILDFGHYLESPVLGNSAQSARLVKIIADKVLEQEDAFLTEELFQEEFYPGGELTDEISKYIWIRFTHLYEKLLQFLAFQAWRENPAEQELNLLQYVRSRELEDYIDAAYQRALNANEGPANADGVNHALQAHILMNDFRNARGLPGEDLGLQEVMDHVDLYFAIQKLKYVAGELVLRTFMGPSVEITGLDIALQFADRKDFKDYSVLQAYALAVRMFQSLLAGEKETGQYYSALKRIIFDSEKLEKNEAKDLFTLAKNYALARHRQGWNRGLEEIISLYDKLLESGLGLENGLISAEFYKNAVMVICQSGGWDWAKTFTEAYKSRISNDPGGLTYIFNCAVIEFGKENWSGVVELLYNEITRFENPAIGVGARIYFCRSLWMKEEYDWLLTSLKTFDQYLRRSKKIPAPDRSRHQQYIRYFRKLALAATARPDIRPQKLHQLAEEIQAAGLTQVLGWLGKTILEMG